MRGRGVTLAVAVLVAPEPVCAQSEPADAAPRTAEQFIEAARALYSVREQRSEPCAAPVGNEIVVCRDRIDPESQRLPSPTERARAAGERPPDPIPDAPYVLGLPECRVEVVCHRMGSAPPPIYIIDLEAIPQPLSSDEAALVFRAEDKAEATVSPEAASPAAAP